MTLSSQICDTTNFQHIQSRRYAWRDVAFYISLQSAEQGSSVNHCHYFHWILSLRPEASKIFIVKMQF